MEISAKRLRTSALNFPQNAPVGMLPTPANESYNQSLMTPGRVLQFHIVNVKYNIDVEIINKICTPYGKVLRICVINATLPDAQDVALLMHMPVPQDVRIVYAWVEFANPTEAQNAFRNLDGNDIYSGCCNITATTSQLPKLDIMKNTSSSVDYTNPNPGMQIMQNNGFMNQRPGFNNTVGPSTDSYNQYKSLRPPPSSMQTRARFMSSEAMGRMSMMPMRQPMNQYSGMIQQGPEQEAKTFLNVEGVVVIFNKLPLHKINCKRLFNLCSLYGNVAKIKFLKTRQDTAMVQMDNPESANGMLSMLNRFKLFDNEVYLGRCRQASITDTSHSFDLEMDKSPNMMDFTHDNGNRFDKGGKSKVLPPTRTVHFFNFPPNMRSEEEIMKLFSDKCKPPSKLAVFPESKKFKTVVGLAEWDDVADAIEAIVVLNNHSINVENYRTPFYIRLAFSPKPINLSKVEHSKEMDRLRQDANGKGVKRKFDDELKNENN